MIRKAIDYSIVYLIIAFSAIQVFMSNKILYSGFTALLLVNFILIKTKGVHKKFGLFLIVLIVLQSVQAFKFQFFSPASFTSTLVLYVMAYLALILVKDFDEKYLKLVYALTVLSLINFALMFVPGYESNLASLVRFIGLDPIENQNMLILTYESGKVLDYIPRNAGFVYEPGIFSFVLIVAVLFEYKTSRSFTSRKNIVFFIALLTTMSTAAYAFISLYVIFLIYDSRIPRYAKVISYVGSLAMVINMYYSVDFLSQKIEAQAATSGQQFVGNRFQSLVVDVSDFMEDPIFGKGRNRNTRFKVLEDESVTKLSHRTNGLSDILVEYGILYFFMFFITMYGSLKRYLMDNRIALLFFLGVLLLGFSQTIFSRPLMIVILFVEIVRLNARRVDSRSGGFELESYVNE